MQNIVTIDNILLICDLGLAFVKSVSIFALRYETKFPKCGLVKIYRGVEQLVARRAHNPKVVSSSLAPATTEVVNH